MHVYACMYSIVYGTWNILNIPERLLQWRALPIAKSIKWKVPLHHPHMLIVNDLIYAICFAQQKNSAAIGITTRSHPQINCGGIPFTVIHCRSKHGFNTSPKTGYEAQSSKQTNDVQAESRVLGFEDGVDDAQ